MKANQTASVNEVDAATATAAYIVELADHLKGELSDAWNAAASLEYKLYEELEAYLATHGQTANFAAYNKKRNAFIERYNHAIEDYEKSAAGTKFADVFNEAAPEPAKPLQAAAIEFKRAVKAAAQSLGYTAKWINAIMMEVDDTLFRERAAGAGPSAKVRRPSDDQLKVEIAAIREVAKALALPAATIEALVIGVMNKQGVAEEDAKELAKHTPKTVAALAKANA